MLCSRRIFYEYNLVWTCAYGSTSLPSDRIDAIFVPREEHEPA